MFFGRDSYDLDQVREAQTRLQAFKGATSISSNQYFGRDEEEGGPRDDAGSGLLVASQDWKTPRKTLSLRYSRTRMFKTLGRV